MNDHMYLEKMANYCKLLVGWLQKNPDHGGDLLPAEIKSMEQAQACFGLIQHALVAGMNGRPEEVVRAVEKSLSFSQWPAPKVLLLWIQALALTDRKDEILELCWRYAERAAQMGDANLCLDSCSNLLLEDLNHEMKWLNRPDLLQRVAQLYMQVSDRLRLPSVAPRPPEGKMRIGLIVPLLPSDGPPFARRALHFAQYLDLERYELFVYSSEGLSQRPAVMPSRSSGHPSLPRGQAVVDQLLSLRAKVHFVSPDEGLTLQAAATLAQQIAQDRIDALIVQSGLNMPIDWMATRMAPVPVKLHIHIGLSAYVPGSDYTLFDNAANLAREREQWPKEAGKPMLLRRGTDIEGLDAVERGDRAELGIPEDAVVMGSLSNNYATRFSPEYANVLCEVLQRCPNAWLMPVGSGQLPDAVWACFEAAGVKDRVRHVPNSFSTARELKMMDVYASEFPHGGSQAVVEALVCSLPVVAMRCGATHYESISADVAGPSSIQGNRPEAYRDRLIELIENPELRAREALASRARAEQHFSIREYVKRVAELSETILARKCGERVDECELFEQWAEQGDA